MAEPTVLCPAERHQIKKGNIPCVQCLKATQGAKRQELDDQGVAGAASAEERPGYEPTEHEHYAAVPPTEKLFAVLNLTTDREPAVAQICERIGCDRYDSLDDIERMIASANAIVLIAHGDEENDNLYPRAKGKELTTRTAVFERFAASGKQIVVYPCVCMSAVFSSSTGETNVCWEPLTFETISAAGFIKRLEDLKVL